jgi:hypothetical protein
MRLRCYTVGRDNGYSSWPLGRRRKTDDYEPEFSISNSRSLTRAKIEELRLVGNDNSLNITDEIARLQDKSSSLTESISAT